MREATAEEIAFLVGQDIWERAFLVALPEIIKMDWVRSGDQASDLAAKIADVALKEWSARFA